MPTRSLRSLLPALIILLSSGLAQEAAAGVSTDVAGTWRGAIEVPGAPLEIVVRLDSTADGWQGTVDIPAQGAAGIPLEAIDLDQELISFRMAGVPGTPTFQGTVVEEEITGIYTQGGQEFPFTLVRGDATADTGTADATQPPTDPDQAVPPEGGPTQEGTYEHPSGLYSFPIPTGWTVEEREGFAVTTSPEGGISVYFVLAQDSDLEAAVAKAWTLVDPEFDLEPIETLEPPSEAGIERTILVNYDAGDSQIFQALAQLHDGTAYVMLIEGELAALQRRNAQLQIVATGFRILGLEETVLVGVDPLPVAQVIDELEVFILETMEAFGIPGASVAIVQGDDVVYTRGFGVTELGSERGVTPATQMMIGSTGKTMTSMLVATLVDDGLVDWDTPVVEVLPEFAVADPELTQQITLRNLLCACTGVPRRDLELFFNADELSAEAIVESLVTFEFFTDFGEAFQYSNQLVATAGYAAAAANGYQYGNLFEGYVESLQERLLDPIGMPNTTLSFEEVRDRGNHALPHQQNLLTGEYEPIDLTFEEVLLPVGPAGAHWSTAEDLARYMITELNLGVAPNGQRVVSEENLRVTWQPQVPVSATDSYGLGWFVGEYEGLDILYHGGNSLGFSSEFMFLPEANIGVVVLTNAQASNVFNNAVGVRLFELVFEQPSEMETNVEFIVEQNQAALAEARDLLQERVDSREVEGFLGRYINPALGEITLELEGDQLVLDAGEFRTQVRPALDRRGEFDTYVTFGVPLTGLPLELTVDENGNQSVILGQGAISYTFDRLE